MKRIEEYLLSIEKILDELIANEEHVRDISLVDPLHEEIERLQRVQEDLLVRLQEADRAFSKASQENAGEFPITAKQRISDKLKRFQQLNDSFIERLRAGRHFIQFEVQRPHREKGD